MFKGVRVLVIPGGVHKARIDVWKRKVLQLGGQWTVFVPPQAAEPSSDVGDLHSVISTSTTHVVAADWDHVKRGIGVRELKVPVVSFAWIQESLRHGGLQPTSPFLLTPSQPPLTDVHSQDSQYRRAAEAASQGEPSKKEGEDDDVRGSNCRGISGPNLQAVAVRGGLEQYGGKHCKRDRSAGSRESEEEGEGEIAMIETRELSEEERRYWMDVIYESARWGIEEKETREGVGATKRGGKRKAWGGKRGTAKRTSKRGSEAGERQILGHMVGLCSPTTSEEREEREERREERVRERMHENQESRGSGERGSGDTWQGRWSGTQESSQACQAGKRESEGVEAWQSSQTQVESQSRVWSYSQVESQLSMDSIRANSQSQVCDGSQGERGRGGAVAREGGEGVSGGRVRGGWEALRRRGDFCRGLYVPPNMNPHIVGIFAELNHIYKHALGDEFRAFSYAKAIPVIEKLPFRLSAAEQAAGLPAIGHSLLQQIAEILSSGTLQRLEKMKSTEPTRSLSLLSSVWGVGPKQARRLFDCGYRSLQQLRDDPSAPLTPAQRIALQFHGDISKRIPRGEVAAMQEMIQCEADKIRPGMTIVCGGSYRRGRFTVGDLDLILSHPDGHSHRGFLPLLLHRLRAMGFVTETLLDGSTNSESDSLAVDTFFGLCCQEGRQQRHRIDFKVFPAIKYPFGLLAWTGNDVLNRRIRLVAESKGLKLDDHGLVRVAPSTESGPNEVRCSNEREVFRVLGCPWLEPHERNL